MTSNPCIICSVISDALTFEKVRVVEGLNGDYFGLASPFMGCVEAVGVSLVSR